MAEATVKFSKAELKKEQARLAQLSKYLPTLQLKKAQLQSELMVALADLTDVQERYGKAQTLLQESAALLSDILLVNDFWDSVKIDYVHTVYKNIAGLEVPFFERVEFVPVQYSLFSTQPWFEQVWKRVVNWLILREHQKIVLVRKNLLEAELQEVATRVNLFDKLLIPRAKAVIGRIKIFLADQELMGISQAKIAKKKLRSTGGSS